MPRRMDVCVAGDASLGMCAMSGIRTTPAHGKSMNADNCSASAAARSVLLRCTSDYDVRGETIAQE